MSLLDPLIAKLGSIGHLSESDRNLLAALPITVRNVGANQPVVHQGDLPKSSILVISGILSRFQELTDGGRQLVSFHLTGEMPDLHTLYIRKMDHSLVALKDSVIGHVPHDAIHAAVSASSSLMALLWRATLIDAAIFRQWMTNNGRRGPAAGTAHLLCEIALRSKVAGGLYADGACDMPFNQQQLADALGISLVHANRTLKSLKERGIALIERGRLRVLDWEALQTAAGFDPTYLHLKADS
ncbi:MAG: Crp/Fnr family transcriptional regulator [Pseudolabrys sp.]|nr:Crp/Fnr family transcriptional regulator [Pseudolabrys sp.]